MEEEVRFLAEEILEHFSHMDVLLNNPSIMLCGIFSGLFRREIYEIPCVGVASSCSAFCSATIFPVCLTIVNTAFTSVPIPRKSAGSYSAAKEPLSPCPTLLP